MTEHDPILDEMVAAAAALYAKDPIRRAAKSMRGAAVAIEAIDLTDELVPWKPEHRDYILDTIEWFKATAAAYDAKAEARDQLRRDLIAPVEETK